MLLIVIPIVLVICFCLFIKWSGVQILPDGLVIPPEDRHFELPKITRDAQGWKPATPPRKINSEEHPKKPPLRRSTSPDFDAKWDYE